MRKIEENLISAIQEWKPFKQDNTQFWISHVNPRIGIVLLHLNIIAAYELFLDGPYPIMFQHAGWPTRTTHSRLRALGVKVVISRGVHHGLSYRNCEYRITEPSIKSWRAVEGNNTNRFIHPEYFTAVDLDDLFPGYSTWSPSNFPI